jgi:hypothetical protein
MKTNNNLIRKLSLVSGLAIALAVAVGLPRANAADRMKGAEHLLHLQGIKTQAEAEALKPGDTLAMVCTKCKTITIERVTVEKGHIKHLTPGEKHLCTGCNTYLKVVGVGKGSKDEVKHVCEGCGDDSAFCCATKPGSSPTKGMEKDKK